MEAFGYETPVAITPTEIFNPTMANMVLLSMGLYANALREDYNNTMKDYKDFMKEYGSFISPIDKDVESYYDLTTGGLGNMFTYASQNGIDLLRSPEGRALVLQYIASRPYKDIAMLRLSADNAQSFLKSVAALRQQGLYDENMVNKLDGNLLEWDTLGKRQTWDKLSATPYMSTRDMLANTLKDLKDNGYDIYDDTSKPGKIIQRVSDANIDAALNRDINDLMNLPQMQYYRDSNGFTDELLYEALKKELRSGLAPKVSEDKTYWDRLNYQHKVAQDAAELAEAQRDHNLRAIANGIDPNTGQSLGDKNGTSSYRANTFDETRRSLGFDDTVINGIRMTPAEVESLSANSYAESYIQNMKVYVKDKNTGKWITKKFKDLSGTNKQDIMSRDTKVRRAYSYALNKFNLDNQRARQITAVNKGTTYHSNASLGLAVQDDVRQYLAQFGDDDYFTDSKGYTLGLKAVPSKLVTIGEITARSGYSSKLNPDYKTPDGEYFAKNNELRNSIKYFNPTSLTGKDLIQQYEPRDHRTHTYRRVSAIDEQGNPHDMWFEKDLTNITSTQASGQDSRSLHEQNVGVKSIEAPIQTR